MNAPIGGLHGEPAADAGADLPDQFPFGFPAGCDRDWEIATNGSVAGVSIDLPVVVGGHGHIDGPVGRGEPPRGRRATEYGKDLPV